MLYNDHFLLSLNSLEIQTFLDVFMSMKFSTMLGLFGASLFFIIITLETYPLHAFISNR